jgi:hypothetical protein
LNIDFDSIKKQDEAVKLIIEKQQNGDKEFLSKLSKVSGNLSDIIKLAQEEQSKKNENQNKKMMFEDEDGFEIFEVNDENQ